jgi:hypothetical protein
MKIHSIHSRNVLLSLLPTSTSNMECYCSKTIVASPPPRCGRCKAQYYCDAVCQRTHWKEHKTACVAAKEEWEEKEDAYDVILFGDFRACVYQQVLTFATTASQMSRGLSTLSQVLAEVWDVGGIVYFAAVRLGNAANDLVSDVTEVQGAKLFRTGAQAIAYVHEHTVFGYVADEVRCEQTVPPLPAAYAVELADVPCVTVLFMDKLGVAHVHTRVPRVLRAPVLHEMAMLHCDVDRDDIEQAAAFAQRTLDVTVEKLAEWDALNHRLADVVGAIQTRSPVVNAP